MINAKKRFSSEESSTFELILMNSNNILINEVHNKYLQSFLGVKDYIEKNLQEKVSDVKHSIHATTSTQKLIHKGHLNIPKVEEIATLLPSNDTITEKHKRYVLFCK